MRQNLRFLALTIVILTSVFSSFGTPILSPAPILFPVVPIPRYEEPLIPDPPIKHRLPAKTLSATVDSDGAVCIEGIDEVILIYEILDLDESSLGQFSDSVSFSQTLFSLKGEYELRFTTSEYVYVGYVWME